MSDLFDGKTLDGWETEDGGQWSIEDGVLTAKPDGTFPRLVYTRSEFTDVRVRVECKLGKGGNSGVHLRTHLGKGWKDGYEAQITNDPKQRTLTGGIYNFADVKEQHVKDDTWFTLEFEANGELLTVWIDGEKTAEVTDRKFKSGQVSLLASDKAPVWFRKVQVKRLD